MQLNSSVVNLLEALNAAPYLKTLPGEVSDLQKQVAQFGSRLTDLESQLTKSESDLRSDLGDIKHDMASNTVIMKISTFYFSTNLSTKYNKDIPYMPKSNTEFEFSFYRSSKI